jgi:hypothetical protein
MSSLAMHKRAEWMPDLERLVVSGRTGCRWAEGPTTAMQDLHRAWWHAAALPSGT